MSVFSIALILSALLCSLVAGFLFAYAVVIMPGIRKFDDKQFIRTFQVTDKIIQDNHPLFILMWLGSAVALLVCAVLGLGKLQGTDFALLLVATVIYLLGVQVATVVVHLPLNNRLQELNVDDMTEDELSAERDKFEPRWNTSNQIRTFIACCASLLLIVLALRL